MGSAKPADGSRAADVEAGARHANHRLAQVAGVLDLLASEMGETAHPTENQRCEWADVASWIAGLVRRETHELTDALAQPEAPIAPTHDGGRVR